MTRKTCKKWFHRFHDDDFDLSERERPGQPKKIEDEELERLLEENFTQTEQKLAHALSFTQQAIFPSLPQLGRIQKAGRWVPHLLSPEKKERLYEMVQFDYGALNGRPFCSRL